MHFNNKEELVSYLTVCRVWVYILFKMFIGITSVYSRARNMENLCGSLVEGVEGWNVTKNENVLF
jgi:hypothetical protein